MRLLGLAVGLLFVAVPAVAAEHPYLPAGSGPPLPCELPGGWQDLAFAEPPPGPAPPPRDGGGGCLTLRTRRHFTVGDELPSLISMDLGIQYRDGFIAWLNGVEVARRGLAPGGETATDPHGGDVEHLAVPLRPGLLRRGDNVLAVEVRPAPGRQAGLTVSLTAADRVRLLRGPHLQQVLDGSATLVVESDLPTRVEVRHQVAGRGSERVTTDGELGTHHRVTLRGLSPATAYRYRVIARTAADSTAELAAQFHTPPRRGQPLRFVVFGDTRSGHDVHAALSAAVAAEDPDLVLMTGDLVGRGTDEGAWERYFQIAAPLLRQVAVYPAPGNHEYLRRGLGLERFLSLFPRPRGTSWWSFDVAGFHFVCLDSEAYNNPEQRRWLEDDLKLARSRAPTAILVYNHDGPWSSGPHGDNATAVRDYAPLYERYGVTAVFSGHDHDYERGRVRDLTYIVTGGGGAELRPQRCWVQPERGQRRCRAQVRAFVNEHHYIVVEAGRQRLRLCPKRADGSLLEPCQSLPYRR